MLEGLLMAILLWMVHTFADFVMQTNWQATNKSSSNKALLAHTGTYAGVWLFVSLLLGTACNMVWAAIIFTLITFVAHTVTDYFTSRWSKRYFSKNDNHNGFVVIGIDQLLHLIQLLLTYYFVTQ